MHVHVLALALASALAIDIAGPQVSAKETYHPVPWYLPRKVTIGAGVNPPTVSIDLRLAWELGVIEQPRNHLVIMIELGTGLTLVNQARIRALYQHVAMVGFGYRSTRELFHWGFSVLTGPLWYRAGYAPGVGLNFENRFVTYSEATAQAGLVVKEHLIFGIFAGYGAPWDITERFPAGIYTGGFRVGVFGEWR